MNVILDPWIPVRRHSGTRQVIAPWQLTEGLADDPIVTLDAPRPDLAGGLIQVLIGLLQTALAPEEGVDWEDVYQFPPCADALRATMLPLAASFQLDGDGHRFMQDLSLAEGDAKPIGALLIDNPGEHTERLNTDHFIKRGMVRGLCPACACTALYTLQSSAPSGGAGHRTSLRGGGPLNTLVVADPAQDRKAGALWHSVWLNVLPRLYFESLSGNPGLRNPEHRFPWLADTRTSDTKQGGAPTTAAEVHPLQMYWAMPRRIRLDFGGGETGQCDLCGTNSHLVTQYLTRNYGVDYAGPWQHPLTPRRRTPSGEWLPQHPQAGGIGYRHWPELVADDVDDASIACAPVVRAFSPSYGRPRRAVRLWAFGYDMDNMKARCWYEALMPLYPADQDATRVLVAAAADLVGAAGQIAKNLREALRKAWFSSGSKVRGDLGFVEWSYWQVTEPDFFRLLDQIHAVSQQDDDDVALRHQWFRVINDAAVRLFDTWAASGDIAAEDPRRIALARRDLLRFNRSKTIKEALRLAVRPLPVGDQEEKS